MTQPQHLTIRQGETWSHVYTHTDSAGDPVDLTGYTARMAIRSWYGGPLEAYLSTGSDADGGTITLGGALGTVTMSMTAIQSASLGGEISYWLQYAPRYEKTVRMVYDLELVNGSTVTRALNGWVFIEREVTT